MDEAAATTAAAVKLDAAQDQHERVQSQVGEVRGQAEGPAEDQRGDVEIEEMQRTKQARGRGEAETVGQES